MHHVMRNDGLLIQYAEAMKVSKVANSSHAIFGRDTWFVETMKELVNYATQVKLEYNITFVDARTKDIIDDTQSSENLPTRGCRTYNQYVRFVRLAIKNKGILDLLEAPRSERTSGKSLGISRVVGRVLYVLEPKDALLLVKVVNFHVTNQTEKANLIYPAFYNAA